nr:hypothetical protein [Thermogemmatispora sp.]
MAGINAALYARGEPGFVLGRHEAYIGVLIDDLVTRPLSEPYRLHTSQAEYRLLLRADSADLRLSDYAYRFGLIDEQRYARVLRKREQIEQTLGRLSKLIFTSSRSVESAAREVGIAPLGQMTSARDLLRRPETHYTQVAELARRVYQHEEGADAEPPLPALSPEVAQEVELQVKYEYYVQKQQQLVRQAQRLEGLLIPESLDYQSIPHLRTEARQKLARLRPRTVGQASRIEGVTPADIAILMVYVEKLRAAAKAVS